MMSDVICASGHRELFPTPLVETDASYLLPEHAPKAKIRRNEPKHLRCPERPAACRNEENGWLGPTTSNNARSHFTDAKRQ